MLCFQTKVGMRPVNQQWSGKGHLQLVTLDAGLCATGTGKRPGCRQPLRATLSLLDQAAQQAPPVPA